MRPPFRDHALLDRAGRRIDQPMWRRLTGPWLALLSSLALSAIGLFSLAALLGFLMP